jgi:hypothetical protein
VPMVVEEPSVVAAASNAAKMVRAGGGFRAEVSRAPHHDRPGADHGRARPEAGLRGPSRRPRRSPGPGRTLAPRLVARGGGPVDVRAGAGAARRARRRHDRGPPPRRLPRRHGRQPGQHHCRGGGRSRLAAWIAGARVGLRILSNLSDQRMVTVRCRSRTALAGTRARPGAEVRQAIAAASRFAELDPYRAATHNKGIMNGVDAVLVATGNDWRAVEAGAHAYAAAAAATRRWRVARRRRAAHRRARDAAGGRHGRRRAARARGRAAGARILAVRSAAELAGGGRRRRAGQQPGGAARAGHRGHPARAHVAARPGGRAGGRRDRRAGRARRRELSRSATSSRSRARDPRAAALADRSPLHPRRAARRKKEPQGTTRDPSHRSIRSQPSRSPPAEPLELEACYRYCEALAARATTTSRWPRCSCPRAAQAHLGAVRVRALADDFADEPQYEGRRARELDRWEEQLERLYFGGAPITRCSWPWPTRSTSSTCPSPSSRPCVRVSHRSRAPPLRHVRRAAPLHGPGRRARGPPPPLHRRLPRSRAARATPTICPRAWPWPSCSRTSRPTGARPRLPAGRGPAPLRRQRGSTFASAAPRPRWRAGALRGRRTRALFERARPLVEIVGADLAVELALSWHGGMRILDKIGRAGAQVLQHRPHLTALDKALVVTRALAWRGGALGQRIWG